MPDYYHLAVAWDWEYDRDFIQILEDALHANRLLVYQVSHHNTHETVRRIHKGDLAFGAFLDRAGDFDEHFLHVSRNLSKTPTYFINPPEAVVHANDKATMHLEFLTKGLDVPFTIIVSPYSRKRELELRLSDIAHLGRPFIIKPANTTGGGMGVIVGAETLKDVIESRQHHKNDKYLLQERIIPATLDGKKAWFRVFYVFGLVIPCWWDDETHQYAVITAAQRDRFGLLSLTGITRRIQEVCHMDFFSTEIAINAANRMVVVDYVNDICDMRLKSKHPDGVPDQVVTAICQRIARQIRSMYRRHQIHHPAVP